MVRGSTLNASRQGRKGTVMRDNLSKDTEKSDSEYSMFSGKDDWAWLEKRS